MTIARFEVPDWIRSVLICDPTDIWGNVVGIGLGELIACLTPAKRFDRRGSVFFIDSFEDGLGSWSGSKGGTGVTPLPSTTTSKHGGLSALLSVGSGGDGTSAIGTYLPFIPETKVGLEVSFAFLDDTLDFLEILLTYYDGSHSYDALVKVKPATDIVTYTDSAGAEQNLFTSLEFLEQVTCFNTLKIVIDLATQKWVRALLNERSTALAVDLRPGDVVGAKYLYLYILLDGDGTHATSVYVSDVVVTINEPA